MPEITKSHENFTGLSELKLLRQMWDRKGRLLLQIIPDTQNVTVDGK